MTQQTTALFSNAELALAAFATLVPGATADQVGALIDQGMSIKQAAEFAKRSPKVVAQFNDTATSFSATVFNDTSGNLTLAIRGTLEPGDFFPTDANIALHGAAYDQIVVMHNWWVRATSPTGQMVQQYRIASAGAPFLLESAPSVAGTGELVDALASDADHRIEITGHSTGAHLALAFNTLFRDVVSHVKAFNTPGFIDSPGNQQFFATLGGAVPKAANSGNVTNVIADESKIGNKPWSAIAGLHSPQGTTVNISIENQWLSDEPNPALPALNHSQTILTDSLAVFNLLSQLAPTLSTTDYKAVFNQAALGTSASYERIVDALVALFGNNRTILPAGNNNRDTLYTAIYGLRSNAEFGGIAGQVRITPIGTELSAAQIAAIAGTPSEDNADQAFRYALKELNPFVVVGPSTLYAPHNVTGELDLYNPATDAGLTREYLADRAEMLGWKNLFYQKDGNVALRGDRIESHQFTDKGIKDDRTGQDLTLTVVGRNSLQINNPAKIIFGSDADETLVGSNIAAGDRLYGGGGADTLQGNQGNDYLEGGNGNDTYVWNTGDGFDTILDTDGIGRLVVNGTVVAGGIKIAQNDYVSADKQTLHFEGDPIAGGVLIVNGDLRIENFTSGELGIVLNDQGSVTEIQPTARLFQGPSFASTIGFGTEGTDRVVTSFVNGMFVAKGGDDLLQVSDGTLGPRLAGGAGQDLLIGGSHEGFGELWGDAGQDILIGGPYAESIIGDSAGFEFFDFEFRGSNFRYSEPNFANPDEDFHPTGPIGVFNSPHSLDVTDTEVIPFGDYFQALNYVLGIDAATDISSHYDDYLDGGGGNDILFGGRGADVLFGGAGNDILDGDGLSLQFQLGVRDAAWREAVAGLFGQPCDDYLDGGDDDDRLTDGNGGNDVFFGGQGNDTILSADPYSESESYANYLEGGDGDDTLTSSNRSLEGTDVLMGGSGNDALRVEFGSAHVEGGSGSDTYIVTDQVSHLLPNSLPRSLIINDFDESGGGTDRLRVTLSSPVSALSITRDESNLYVGGSGDSHWITVEDWFTGSKYKIEEIVFDNGTTPGLDEVYDVAAIESRFATTTATADFIWGSNADEQLVGGLGDDTLFGNVGSDILSGNEGNDTLVGGEDGDTYAFNIGDGVDHILDTGSFGSDAITFGPGITPEMLTLSLGSLLITVGENGDVIHIEGFDPYIARDSSSIELFQFADGAQLTYGELVESGFDIVGTAADDVLQGTSVNDRFNGGAGNDTYLFDRGSGQDVIEDIDATGVDIDTVRVGAAVTPADMTVTRAGDFINLAINGTSDQLSIHWQPEQGYGIERVEFSDGTVWDAAVLEANARSSSNTAPTVANSLMDQAAQKDLLFGFQVPEDAFRDMDQGEILDYSAALANGDPLPAWLTFDSASRQFTGMPAASDIGAISIRVTAIDLAGASATDEFQLVVSDGGECHEMNLVGSDDCDNRDHDHGKRDHEHRGTSHGRNHFDRDNDRSDRMGDRIPDCLAAYLECKPRYDFEVLAQERERLDRHGETLNAQEIARRWLAVGRYAGALANEHDEDARGGADYRFNEHGLLGGDAYGGGFGYSGSTGALRRVANLQTFQGLEEGLQRLRP